MITVQYVETIDALRGFTIYDGDYNIIINSHLNTPERTETYLKELKNIENGKYKEKLKCYNKELAL
jgi:hypothetical protein